MASYKEIVTKAVIGKGKKFFENKYSIDADVVPSTILGCWIINHKFNGYEKNDNVVVDGSFDINIWYSTDNDTKTNVINKTIKYSDEIAIKDKIDLSSSDSEIVVRALEQPTCKNATIDGNTINFDIEKELGIEVVGDTKVKIMVEDNEDNWVSLNDVSEEKTTDEQIDEQVQEEFLD